MRKISWQDGMFIHPQHFQQQDLCFENLIKGYYRTLPYFGYGILSLKVDQQALRMNKVILQSCVGLLPDGTFFDAPVQDKLPKPITVPPEYGDKFIYIGTALNQRANSSLNESHERDLRFRYTTERLEFSDMHSREDELKDLDVCHLNLNLLISTDDLNGIVYIPLFKVKSAVDGVILDEDYIPPTIRAKSSSALCAFLVRILSLLHSYANTHFKFLRTDRGTQYSGGSERWLIFQTVHRYQYLFSLFQGDPHLSPYKLFELLVDAIGALSAFTTRNVFDIPKLNYDPDDIAGSFKLPLLLLEKIFSDLGKQKVIRLDFDSKDGLYTVLVPQDLDLSEMDLILSITFGLERHQDLQAVFNQLKVSSSSEIKKIIAAQVAGIRFVRLSELSPYVDSQKDTVYAQLMPEGYLWEQFVKERDLSLYTSIEPESIKNITLWIVAKD